MTIKDLDKEARMQLLRFVRRHGNSLGRFFLLVFWSKHPNTHFSLPCLEAVLGPNRYEAKEALGCLVEEGIVEEKRNAQGVMLFSLSSQQGKREPVLALGQMDWGQAQKLSQLACHRSVPAVSPALV